MQHPDNSTPGINPLDTPTVKATSRSAISPPHRVQPPLSPTERTVLSHLLQGLTERQVAEQLQRSPNTVHVHVRNIYRKIGVNNRKMLIQAVVGQAGAA